MKKQWGLTISLVLFVFGVMMAAVILTGVIFIILSIIGVSFSEHAQQDYIGGRPFGMILSMMAVSILLGTTIAAFFSKKALKPIRQVINATRRIAEGDFNTRVELKGMYELEELSSSFNKMAQELSSVESLRRDFINNFSSEFKTPIVSIRGFAKLLKEGVVSDDEKQEYLGIIITESERLAVLSTNVLNLSKYESLETIADKTPFRVDEQIRRAIVIIEPEWSAKDLDVDVEMDAVTYNGNADLTQQIWLNLIDNAVKYSNPDGNIIIRLKHANGGICFIIKDNGIGMDEQTISRIFDKFYQGDSSRTKPGNGLGLTIIKRIVDLYGGKIDVKSELGVGSEFSVWLPTV